ncbi:hypothetical protein BDW02DRAFT_579891 [Decorospora gaudefroyi]|uniref:Extracellular serine-rich protein n=1 Tax=Decorospora gaudefroyi TaxID=184978 RepID=A0A6A5KFI4_9PLEO|nr:hypothetical protein BDW02DRAFT_579891 [Decorospora gaudefroyi]
MASIIGRPLPHVSLLLIALLLFIQLPPSCLAQDSSNESPRTSSTTTSRSSSTSSAPAQTHTIQVGLADHKFKPEVTNANVGDTIEFAFYPVNHSVVRAEYGYPCIPYEMTGPDKVGFFSGFHAVSTVLSDPPTYSVLVNDTEPIFFYCSAPGSCLTYGMVGAVNPNATMSVEEQQALALESDYMLNPGEPFPAESPLPSNLPTSSAAPGAGAGAGAGAGVGVGGNKKGGLSTGAIAGIIIAAISLIILAALLFFFWGRTKSLKDEVDRKAGTLRRVSPSSSTAMLESGTGRTEEGGGGGGSGVGATGLGIYHHHQQSMTSPPPTQPMEQHQQIGFGYSTPGYETAPPPPPPPPAPSYFHAPQPHPQTSHKFEITSPVGHPACVPSSHHNHPLNISRALSHRSVGGTFELSPTGDYTRTHDHDHDHGATSDSKFGPYGQQQVIHTPSGSSPAHTPAPSYFETVYRPRPVHVNGQVGPAEMDATRANTGAIATGDAVVENFTAAPPARPKWEEVDKRGMF